MTPQELKNSILQLAIQGKLVEQCPEEGIGEELYQQIQAEKQRLIKAGTIKKETPFEPITDEEKPYDIPENWAWVRLGELGHYKKGPFGSALTKGMFVPKGNGAIKVYEQKNAIQKDAHIGDYYITREYFETKMSGFEVHPGDVIVSCAGTIGETYVLPEKIEQGIINQALMRMQLFNPIFVPYFLVFFDVGLKRNAQASSKGSAIKNIPPFEVLKNYLVPLPPLAEQKRIVAKIEELLPYIDRYEQAWSKLEDFNKRFPSDMQKSILRLAIQGKLVEQRQEEGTAEELYQQIQAEKQRLIEAGSIKKEKPLPEITEDEKPFDIPDSWKWVRIGQIFSLQAGKNITASDIYEELSAEHSFLCYGGNGIRGYVSSNNRSGHYALIGRQGALCGNINFAYGDFYATEHAVVVDHFQMCDVLWSCYFLRALNLNQYATATAQPGLAVSNIVKVLIPLPPLAEQKRIVAKIEELLPLCERLK